MRLREQVIKSTVALFDAGALPREIPLEEVVSNEKLIQGIQVKLLPAHHFEDGEGTNKRVSKRKRGRGSQKKKTNTSSGDPEK